MGNRTLGSRTNLRLGGLGIGRSIFPQATITRSYASGGQRLCDAAVFNGSTTRMVLASPLAVQDSKSGIFSAWVRRDGGAGVSQGILVGGIQTLSFGCRAGLFTDFFFMSADQSGGVKSLDLNSQVHGVGPTWYHVLGSWNQEINCFWYVNDTNERTLNNFLNAPLLYAPYPQWQIGCSFNVAVPQDFFFGALAEIYFAPGYYLDFSIVANRRKFITAAGKPAQMGYNAYLPTGDLPSIYFHLDKGEPPANFAYNRGTGGNPWVITGPLTTASTSPSD